MQIILRNFLGEKYTRVVMMPEGVTAANSGNKDEYQIDGNDIEAVSQAGECHLIFVIGLPCLKPEIIS